MKKRHSLELKRFVFLQSNTTLEGECNTNTTANTIPLIIDASAFQPINPTEQLNQLMVIAKDGVKNQQHENISSVMIGKTLSELVFRAIKHITKLKMNKQIACRTFIYI